jgi:aspartyl-tRNA(Asn)/glutamyl-tRNA(Gln) amidotransferase subunit A
MKGQEITADIFFAPIAELSARLKKREFSAVELVRAFAQRLEMLGPRYNALALPLTEIAVRRAKEVDDELKRERYRGPLQGIPFGAKDLLALAGHPTTWGAKPFATQIFDETATVLEKLDKTGSILVGKLSMVELAGGGGYRTTAASLFGPGLNPWDTGRWSGGSSSGPASAVSAGLVPFALGSETSGSILSPSAYCGVTGLRPTYGLVSRHGAMALAWTMDKIGPLCRSAEDCGLVLQTIAGADSKDPGSAGKSFYYTPEYSRKVTDLTVGFAPDDMAWADAASLPALQAAMQAIRSTGVQMKEVTLPDFPYNALADMVIGAEGGAIFEPLIATGKVDELADPSQAASLKANLGIAAKDYLKAMRIRSLLKQKFHELFSTVDVLVAPTRYNAAPGVSDPLDGPDPTPSGQPATPGMRWLIQAGNLAGIPALSIPCGFAPGNLPVGLQIVGPAFSENTLLALGRAFQIGTDWHKRRPPLVS